MKKFCAIVLLVVLAGGVAHAQNPTPVSAPVPEVTVEKKKFDTAGVKAWLAEAFATTEAFRLKQAVHFTELREEKKAELKIDKLPEFDEQATLGVAGTEPAPLPAKKTPLQNPLEYGMYILSISLATLFSNQVIFYLSSALLFVIIFRFLVSRFV